MTDDTAMVREWDHIRGQIESLNAKFDSLLKTLNENLLQRIATLERDAIAHAALDKRELEVIAQSFANVTADVTRAYGKLATAEARVLELEKVHEQGKGMAMLIKVAALIVPVLAGLVGWHLASGVH